MGTALALAAVLGSVAGGSLGLTASPERPRVGQRVTAYTTGYVGERGHLYVYRTFRRACADTERGARATATRLLYREVTESFEYRVSYVPRRARRERICAYLYSHACDAAGTTCGPALGLPPDAGFSRFPITVRPRR